jgi:hypothetical protein
MTVAATRPEALRPAPLRAAPGPAPASAHARPGGVGEARPEDAAAVAAARRFEGLLVAQLLQEMRKTIPGGGLGAAGGGAASQYMAMFDDAVAEALTSGGGLGLSPMLAEGMGASPDAVRAAAAAHVRPGSTLAAALSPQGNALPASMTWPGGAPLPGAGLEADDGGLPLPARLPLPGDLAPLPGGNARLATAAAALVRGGAERWSREGRLDASLLASPVATPARDGGVARFNVEDARGFEGSYKCNLFALEAARRAGYAVPLQARPRGWGFPAPDGVVRDAEDGRLRDDWARVATGMDAGAVQRAIASGRGFLLAGSGTDGHAGHMAVVERVHEIRYDRGGHVERVVFDGWEARARGAERLLGRVWCRAGHPQPGARNGLGRIELLELREPTHGTGPEITHGAAHRGSLQDGLTPLRGSQSSSMNTNAYGVPGAAARAALRPLASGGAGRDDEF